MLVITLVYLFLEVLALRLLSSVFSEGVPFELMSSYERFGYATVGLGAIIIIWRLAYVAKIKTKGLALLFLMTPLFYICTVWISYEVIYQSPSFIAEEKRPKALRAALNTLSTPSWSNMFYFHAQSDGQTISSEKIDTVIDMSPYSDRVIRSVYISGLRNINQMSKQYKRVVTLLDRDYINRMWHNSGLSYKGKMKHGHNEYITELSSWHEWYHRTSYPEWLNQGVVLKLSRLNQEERIRYEIYRPYIEGHKPIQNYGSDDLFVLSSRVKNEVTNVFVWQDIRQKIPLMGNYIFDSKMPITERARLSISKNFFEPVSNIPGALIPWSGKWKDPTQNANYQTALKQMTPFFLNEDGEFIITVKNVYNDDTLKSYVNTLRTQLPKVFKKQWNSYLKLSYTEMSHSQERWNRPVEYELHKDMLRIGAVLPFMLLVSATLIAVNITLITKENKKYGVFALIIALVAWLHPFDGINHIVVDSLNNISVKESQVFLH